MKYISVCVFVAMCILVTGCAAADSKPDSTEERDRELIEQMVTGERVEVSSSSSSSVSVVEDEPIEIETNVTEPVDETPVDPPSPQETVTTPVITTTPDSDNDFYLFFDEVHELFDLTEEEMSFVDQSLLVGDSICSGFSEYGIVSRDHVAAKGNLGSRSFFDYTFKFRGKEGLSYQQVLKMAKPRYVFLSMGMNDVNMVNEKTYCENYRRVIEATLNGSDAEVFVAAITPVCSKFCGNSVIDNFNNVFRDYLAKEFPERVHFYDFGQYLKNDRGELRACLHSGDGVHLGPYCYYIALWEMRRALIEAGLWNGAGPVGTVGEQEEAAVETGEPSATTAEVTSSETDEQTRKPVSTKTTTKTTEKTKPKPSTTSTSAESATGGVPVEVYEPEEIKVSAEQTSAPSEEALTEENVIQETVTAAAE